MIAVVTTTPARAYTIRHPAGQPVAEVLWGDLGRPVLQTYRHEDGRTWAVTTWASWHKACDEAQAWARDEWSLTVPEPDDGLDDEGNPIPQPADPRLLAMANRALGEQLDEARAEVERLKALCNDPEPIETRVLAAQMDGDQRVVAMMRERDEARAQLRQACASDNHRAIEYEALRGTYLAALAEVERLRARPVYTLERGMELAKACHEDGVNEERARIVAWLRADDSLSLASFDWLTDAIERGEYELMP
jgi:hypothetical protein